ncbi:MAG: sugar transporter [Gammaproteobacteria bacterium RIFCSPHIGHO2_12_FULL_40_19]|nr:MAG: sugar transporter [Gammaproteobacteria bacterium RIFCSPHIGHO2_12_FULL_40_19]
MKKVKRSSDILLEMAHDKKLDGDLTFHRILQLLGDRAFGLALIFFALPSALPISAIPGISFFFGIPILALSLQMVFMRKTLWLPKRVAQHTIHHKTLVKIVHASTHYLQKMEIFLKPRLVFMTSKYMECINGTVLLALTFLLMLPIPLSNFILASLIIIFSLGLMEKDGVFIIATYVGGIIYVAFIYTVILSVIRAIF